MLIIQKIKEYENQLEAAGVEAFAFEFTYRRLHKMSKLDWLNLVRQESTVEISAQLEGIFTRLIKHEPPQYIVGHAEFCDLEFKVDERVLIPRPETEELVEKIRGENKKNSLKILDMGTGSGAIGLSLKHACPDWQMTLSDISNDALTVAQENAENLGLQVQFIQSDLFSNINEKYDIIASNPPYIAFDDKEMDQSVKLYEPDRALYATDEGLANYRELAHQAKEYLAEDGKIYLEIGYKQGQAVQALFEQAFPDKQVQIVQDSFGKDRMVVIK
ncbi:MAG: peptide chain release factor N(5)-glutamine methyltransferase [Streptococcaceae bacterium]|nr:peptide chain release factor N(5)-glutamine methyltransferase [Streptococcaceae bacterium]